MGQWLQLTPSAAPAMHCYKDSIALRVKQTHGLRYKMSLVLLVKLSWEEEGRAAGHK